MSADMAQRTELLYICNINRSGGAQKLRCISNLFSLGGPGRGLGAPWGILAEAEALPSDSDHATSLLQV